MRKIFIPVLTFLMLISFVSCNLDNNGILWTGVNRYPSDDKDRNFIGYISDIQVDSNNLTRSGYITPAVDFKNLQEVLVITTTKADLTGENET